MYPYKRKATKMKNYFQRAVLIAQGFPRSFLMVVSTHCSLGYSIWGKTHRILIWGLRSQENIGCCTDPSWVCHRKWLQSIWANLALGSIITKDQQRNSTVRSGPQPLVTQRFCRCFSKGACSALESTTHCPACSEGFRHEIKLGK